MDRPVGFYIIALLQIMVGLYLILTGVMWFGIDVLGLLLASPDHPGVSLAASVVGIALGVFMFILAGAFFNETKWAWAVTLFIQIGSVLRELFSVGFGASTMGIASIVLSIVIIFYLFRPEIRSRFA